jgi:hypothetical protein
MRMIDIEWWQNMRMGTGRRESERQNTEWAEQGMKRQNTEWVEQGMVAERGMKDYYCSLNK